MKARIRYCLSAAVLLIALGGARNEAPAQSRQSGRVVSTSLSGHGLGSRNSVKKSTVWWIYCIASDGRFYTVVSRENPEKIALTENSMVQFTEKNNRIYIVRPGGRRVALRILRKGESGKCP